VTGVQRGEGPLRSSPHSFHGLQSTFLRPIQSFAFGIVSRFEFRGLASRDRWGRGRGAGRRMIPHIPSTLAAIARSMTFVASPRKRSVGCVYAGGAYMQAGVRIRAWCEYAF
jgi:hypothetical protein